MPSFWSSWSACLRVGIIADRPVTYVVPFRWILEMALGDVLGGITLTCSASEVRLLHRLPR